MTSSDPRIVVYGATGETGARVCRALVERGAAFAIAGRSAARLEALAGELGDVPVRVAAADDRDALAAAFAGAAVVASCAGPFGRIGEPVVAAAIAAGAHYLDAAGEQGFLRDVYERHGGAARRRGVAAVSGVAFEIAIGDWACAWAAEMIAGPATGGRIGEDDPLDEVTVSYAVDDPATSPATRRSYADMLAAPSWVWAGDRWDPSPIGAEQRIVNFGPALGGERPALSFPSGEVITVPRHVAADRVQTYLSLTRSRWIGTIARAATRLAPTLYQAGAGRLIDRALAATSTASDPADTRFALIARARRRFAVAQVSVLGSDPYALTATLIADAACDLATSAPRVTGAVTPAELWPAEASLRQVAEEAGMTIDAC